MLIHSFTQHFFLKKNLYLILVTHQIDTVYSYSSAEGTESGKE